MKALLRAALLPSTLSVTSAAAEQMPFAPKVELSREAVSAGPPTYVPAQTFPQPARYQSHTMKPTLTLLVALLFAPLTALHAADTPAPATYDVPNRPQFHFTPPYGWRNDPSGMFYYKGEYHMHYLGAPEKAKGGGWGNVWMHLVSKDMIHWDNLTLHYSPAKELQSLRQQPVQLRDQTIGENSTLLTERGIQGELFEVVAEFEIGKAKEFGIEFCKGPGGSFKIGYDVSGRKLTLRDPKGTELLSQLLLAKRGRVKLHLLIDRSMLDVFGNDGLTWNCVFFKAEQPAQQGIEFYAKGGETKLLSLDLWPLKSV